MIGESAPKKANTLLLAGKTMATVFWDYQGIVMIDYLKKGKTITEACYVTLLDRISFSSAKFSELGSVGLLLVLEI